MSVRAELGEKLKVAREYGLVHVTGSVSTRENLETDQDVEDQLVILNNIFRLRASNLKPTFTV